MKCCALGSTKVGSTGSGESCTDAAVTDPWTNDHPGDDRTLMEPPEADRRDPGAAFTRLVRIMTRLRQPGGCPWDAEQTLETLKGYLVEETYEVLDAIDGGQLTEHREELGDLLLQVVFQAELRREAGAFDAADVAHGIADKLVRRHPHVFGDRAASTGSEALREWGRMKAAEKKGRSVVDGVPRALPALARAQKVGDKSSRVGFDWPDVGGALAKVREEVGELEAAARSGDAAQVSAELGDVLFALVNVARHTRVSAEDALHATVEKFRARFQHVERRVAESGQALGDVPLEVLDRYWDEAKALGLGGR
jgi:MazG family protein